MKRSVIRIDKPLPSSAAKHIREKLEQALGSKGNMYVSNETDEWVEYTMDEVGEK